MKDQFLAHRQQTSYSLHCHVSGAGDANALSLEDSRAMTDAISSNSTEIRPHRETLDASREEASPAGSVSKEDLLELGCFGTPHGVRGEIKLFPTTDSADERLLQPGKRCPQYPLLTWTV